MELTEEDLVEAIKQTFSEFRSNELAYLALTSKIEHAFRDRLAFLLHARHFTNGYLIAREWSRVDLVALTSTGLPKSLIELKAAYSFDLLKDNFWFTSRIASDLVKARKLGGPDCNVYALLLLTHVAGSVAPKLHRLIKYSAGINRSIKNKSDAATVLAAARGNISGVYAGRIVAEGECPAGDAFGLTVAVSYWLLRE